MGLVIDFLVTAHKSLTIVGDAFFRGRDTAEIFHKSLAVEFSIVFEKRSVEGFESISAAAL